MNVNAHLVSICLATLGACVQLTPSAPHTRAAADRSASVIRVESSCGGWAPRTGSGTIISERHVLTTSHIVQCTELPDVHVTYRTHDGEHRMRMVVVNEDQKSGIARLEIASAEQFGIGIRPPVVRLPDPGNVVCANLSAKDGSVTCGTVESNWTVVNMPTRARNDGAPVYCDAGTLVGIVVNRGTATGASYTFIAPIEDRWLDGIVIDQPREHVTVRMP